MKKLKILVLAVFFLLVWGQSFVSAESVIDELKDMNVVSQRAAELEQDDYQFLVDRLNEFLTWDEFSDSEKIALADKGIDETVLNSILNQVSEELITNYEALQTALKETDVTYVRSMGDRLQSELPAGVKTAMISRGMDSETLIVAVLKLMSSGLDPYDGDSVQTALEKVMSELEINMTTTDWSTLADMGLSASALADYLLGSSVEQQTELNDLLEKFLLQESVKLEAWRAGEQLAARNDVFYLKAGDILKTTVKPLTSGLEPEVTWAGVTFAEETGTNVYSYTIEGGQQAAAGVEIVLGDYVLDAEQQVEVDNVAQIGSVSSLDDEHIVGTDATVKVTVTCEKNVDVLELQMIQGEEVQEPVLLSKRSDGWYEGSFSTAGWAGDYISSVFLRDWAGNEVTVEGDVTFSVLETVPSIGELSYDYADHILTINIPLQDVETVADIAYVAVDIGDLKTGIIAEHLSGTTYQATWQVPEGLEESALEIAVYGQDIASQNFSKTITWSDLNIDSKAPVISYDIIGEANDLGWYQEQPFINVTADEGEIFYQIALGTYPFGAVQTVVDDRIPEVENISTVVFWAKDEAGNETKKYELHFQVDTIAPTVELSPDYDPLTSMVALDITVSEEAEIKVYQINKNGSQTLLENLNNIEVTNEKMNFQVVAVDRAGNVGIDEEIVDGKKPIFTIMANEEKTELTVTADEAVSDLRATLNGDAYPISDLSETVSVDPAASIDFIITGKDAAGNEGSGEYIREIVSNASDTTIAGEDFQIKVPAGALGDDLTKSIAIEAGITDEHEAETTDHEFDVLMNFGPEGTVFAQPIEVTLPISETIDETNKHKVRVLLWREDLSSFETILYWDGEIWKNVLNESETIDLETDPVNEVAHTVTFQTKHFSEYAAAKDDIPPVLTLEEVDNYVSADTVLIKGETEAGALVTVAGEQAKVGADGSFEKTISLAENTENIITVKAQDTAENETIIQIKVTQDNTKPGLSLNEYELITKHENLNLSGTVSDTNFKELTVSDVPIDVTSSGAFSIELPLDHEGDNNFVLQAFDFAGNLESRSITIRRDTWAQIEVTAPLTGTLTAADSVEVKGKSSSDQTGTVTLENITPGANISSVTGTVSEYGFSETIPLFKLAGTTTVNTLRVTFTDDLENESSSIIWSIAQNSEAPTIVVTTEVPNQTTASSIMIAGTITATADLVSSGWYATADTSGEDLELTGDNFLFTAHLLEGENEIDIYSATAAVMAEEVLMITKDTLGPEITVVSPTSGSTVEETLLSINGTLSEPGSIMILENGNESNVAVAGGGFSLIYELTADSVNTITLVAEDGLGNETAEELTITHQTATSSSGSGGGGGGGGAVVEDEEEEILSQDVEAGKSTRLLYDNGRFQLLLPVGAVSDKVKVEIKKVDEISGYSDEQYLKIGENIYEVTIKDQKEKEIKEFAENLVFEISYADEDQVIEAAALKICYWEEELEQWMVLPTTIDTKNKKAAAYADHLTIYGLLEVAEFPSLSDLVGHWAESYVYRLANQSVVSGDPSGDFRPQAEISRQEFAKMAVLASGLDLEKNPVLTFDDKEEVAAWAVSYVATAVEAGIINGYEDNTFRGRQSVTRAELAAMVARSFAQSTIEQELGFVDADQIPVWAIAYVAKTVESGIINGYEDNTFRPLQTATRAEAAKMIAKMMVILED